MRIFIIVHLFLFASLAAVASVGGVIVLNRSGDDGNIAALADRYTYDVAGWELRHFPGKLLYTIGHLFDGGSAREADDALLLRYDRLVSDIRELERQTSDSITPQLESSLLALRQERQDLENRVESILEDRIDDLLRDEELTISPPLFSDIALIFPPVDFELDQPPQVLAVSPRDRIYLDANYLLQAGLNFEQTRDLELDAETAGVSAIVIAIGGISTYPSIIPELSDSQSITETAIHEWLHQYLALHPLGRRYFASSEMRTLNETVANMVAAELSRPLAGILPAETAQTPPPPAGFDFPHEMRQLRLDVERLLQQGNVEEAERLMEERRRLFAEKGYFIRKLNQAYFAHYGFYADAPASIDPIGPKLQALRQQLGSVREFVHTVARFEGVADLDRALAEIN